MNWSKFIRQTHRVLSMTFTLFVLANIVLYGRGDVSLWIGFLTLIPLILLLLSGLYLFALPYVARWRNGRRPIGEP